jgi:hypothetical protein
MNNPGIDLEIWKQLREKWTELDAKGHKIKVDFKLIADSNDKKNILAIDAVQHIDNEIVTETVQHIAGEAYPILGIAGLSMERLVEVLKEMLKKSYNEANQRDADLIVTMLPTSPTSGEIKAVLAKSDAPVQSSLLINYRYYYMLNALREQMVEATGDNWKQVRAVYHLGDLEFYFEY